MPTISADATSASEISQRYNVSAHSIDAVGVGRADRSSWDLQLGLSGLTKIANETGGECFSSVDPSNSFLPIVGAGSDARWSQLTILLASDRALCSHESHREGSAGGALFHVRREARRKVRAQHWTATNRTASRPPLSGFGEVNHAETSDDRWQ
jgi:hypothetical protein